MRRRGVPIAGVLAHGLWRGGIRSGFDIEDLATGARHPLSRRVDAPTQGGVPFRFVPEGERATADALRPEILRRASLIAIDEVGRMELGGGGFAHQLSSVLEQNCLHVWVVRDAFVSDVAARWSLAPTVIDATKDNAPELLVGTALDFLAPHRIINHVTRRMT